MPTLLAEFTKAILIFEPLFLCMCGDTRKC